MTRFYRHRRPPEMPLNRLRKCLGCEEQFWSQGPHNRMCNACRKRASGTLAEGGTPGRERVGGERFRR